MSLYIGLDIGGTKLMVAAADGNGKILRKIRTPTSDTLHDDLDALNQMIGEVAYRENILGMGAAIGGPLDWKTGVVSPLHQPDWKEVPLKKIMEKRWGCPFYVDIDTNVAALGEYYMTDLDVSRFLYITLSTGMGGGFLLNGKVYRGDNDAHPEIGHQSVAYRSSNPQAVQCECGAPDCLEALVSGNGIQRIYGKRAEKLTETERDEVAFNLGLGLRNAATFYAPNLIRIGGGVAVGSGKSFIKKAAKVMSQHLYIVPPPIVELSHLGYETTLRGAIVIAIKGLHD